MNKVIKVTDEMFKEVVLQSDIPVLVDFWAPWCGPCKMIAPLLDQLAIEYDGKVRVVKIDVDDNTNMASRYNVRGLPTLMLFKGGMYESMKSGAISKAQMCVLIDSNI